MKSHVLGYPRIGKNRELKFALEKFWRNEIDSNALNNVASEIKNAQWQKQVDSGLDFITVGDFSFYDHVLDHAFMFNLIPQRFQRSGLTTDQQYFLCARGKTPDGESGQALELTKWFDTNYHYLVPELDKGTTIALNADCLLADVCEASKLGQVKPVVIGPLTLLWLSKSNNAKYSKLALLPALAQAYGELLTRLKSQGVEWVQIDEPILAYELDSEWQSAFRAVYQALNGRINIMLATYFASISHQLWVLDLPIQGVHIDAVRAPVQVNVVARQLNDSQVLSLGCVDGRNIWANDLNASVDTLASIRKQLGDRLWVAPSCSLLHSPYTCSNEENLPLFLKPWLSFAEEKLAELNVLKKAVQVGRQAVANELEESRRQLSLRASADEVHCQDVKVRLKNISKAKLSRRSPYKARQKIQSQVLSLPALPTTTIGSFPQTSDIRKTRLEFKRGNLSKQDYEAFIRAEIKVTIERQEALGIDVLVHGEAERTDMVEHFAEYLTGFAFTSNGWVQSFGSRCVKPPIIYGDVSRKQPMTVNWATYAQSLTNKPVKGMLTGPVTILQWSFVRNDQPRSVTCNQIALALRDEVIDLERAGINVIQIDEPALREGLPLREQDQHTYIEYAVNAFRLAANGVTDQTQIHTHMCYADFDDIISAIEGLDVDVITLESSRSNYDTLDVFSDANYQNEVGPGVFDIHSPRVPESGEIISNIQKILKSFGSKQVWVNPDCGLKTRHWDEVEPALANMVAAAKACRAS